ncbi:tetratricopeptide repeat protein [Roseibacillus persicicus]|uniref:tetratricopeptide repeat protein n=1 Tax=Roseibacillus persicicus TaxID=454148 RepID=UPI00398B4987
MAAPSQVLYALHKTIEPQGFENLCVDLLIREGYSRIIPGGKSKDHGRDAELRYWLGNDARGPRVAFQFSLEQKWEPKLRRDIEKILGHRSGIEKIVFVTSRSITVQKQDTLKDEFRESKNIVLTIYDEGWFRVRLEEEHLDLTEKHLGITLADTPSFLATQVTMLGLNDWNQEKLLSNTTPEKLKATFKAQTLADSENWKAWKGLADVEFHLREDESALTSVTRALKLCDDEVARFNMLGLKAMIIAEQGIASGSRAKLQQAKKILEPFVEKLGRSVDHYNMGNIESALRNLKAGEHHYRKAVALDQNHAQSWKNLGSLLFKLKQPEEGMRCLDRALELNPNLPEALCSKANILVLSTDDVSGALELMEKAFEIDPDLERHWPYAHYWYAMALCRSDRLEEALAVAQERYEIMVDCPYLARLVTDLMSEIWRGNKSLVPEAESHFEQRLDSGDPDYRVLLNYLDILLETGREEEAWVALGEFLELEEMSIKDICKRAGLSLADLTDSFASVEFYQGFREISPLADYGYMLQAHGVFSHPEVAQVLSHLLVVVCFRVGAVVQGSDRAEGAEAELKAFLENYSLLGRIFAGLGGWLLGPEIPLKSEEISEKMSAALLVGRDFPLIEISRLMGYLAGAKGIEPSEKIESALVDATSDIVAAFVDDLLNAVGEDWNIPQFLAE